MKWTNRYDSFLGNEAYGITADSLGNVYITGMIRTGGGAFRRYCTIKYDSYGSPLWNTLDVGFQDIACGVTVDSSNNVYITGRSVWTQANYGYCTIKYDTSGNSLWTNRYDSGGMDEAYGIAVDSSDNIYVTGNSSNNYCTIKYTSSSIAIWTNFYDSGGDDTAYGVAVDSSDNIYVTGQSGTIKYNSSGLALWTNIIAYGNGVAVDSSDNFYVTGALNTNYRTVKFSPIGLSLWIKSYNGGGDDTAYGVAVDSSDNIYVTGQSYNGTNYDYCTIKYSSSGSALWTNYYNSGSGDIAHGIAVATNFNPDRIFITGISRGNDWFTYGIPPQKPPANFTGTPLSNNSIIWQWQDNSDDEEGFQIQDSGHNIKGSIGMNITVWTETGLSPNTSYTRHCVATNFLGKSYDSNPAVIFLGPFPPPSIPIIININVISYNQIDLIWNDVATETSYILFRSTVNDTNTATNITNLSANVTNYSDKKLTPNTTYYYWIKAYNIAGNSGFSLVAFDTTFKIANLDNLIIGPSPFKPNDNNFTTGTITGGITFANLTADAIMEIYTVAGQLVEKLKETDGDGKYIWIVPDRIASGVYICRVTNSKGEEKIRKIIIIK